MAIPAIPVEGSTNWYPYAQGLDAAARAALNSASTGVYPVGNYVTVQAAIDAAAAAGGGLVQLPAGPTPVTATLQMKSKVILAGPPCEWSVWGYNSAPTDFHAAWLAPDTSTTGPVINFAADVINAGVRDLMVKGVPTRDGIVFTGANVRSGSRLRNVYVNGAKVGVIVGQQEIRLRDLCVMVCASDGVQINAQDAEWEGGVVGYNGGNGVVLGTTSGPARILVLDTFYNTLAGLVLDGFGHVVSTVQANNNQQQGILFRDTTNSALSQIIVQNNGQEFPTSGIAYSDVHFAHPSAGNQGCSIVGGAIYGGTPTKAAVESTELIPGLPTISAVGFSGIYSGSSSPYQLVNPLSRFVIRGCVNVPDVLAPQGGVPVLFRPNGTGDLVQAFDGNATSYWGVSYNGAVYDKTLGLVLVGDPRMGTTIGTWSGANRCIFARVTTGGQTITKIGLEVGVSSGNISVAVYRGAGTGKAAVPSALLATSGTVPCPAAGYAEITLPTPVTVYPGDWLALSCDNATASFNRWAHPTGSDALAGLVRRQDAAHPAPSIVGTLAASAYTPVLHGIP